MEAVSLLVIKNIQRIEEPPEEVADRYVDRLSFSSHDGRRMAWFTHDGEHAEGAPSWSVRVGDRAAVPASIPELIMPGSSNPMIQVPIDYQPWTADGQSLLIAFWKARPVLMDPDSRTVRELPIDGLPHIAACSPTQPTALLVTYQKQDNAWFISFESGVRVMKRFTLPSTESHPSWHAFWLAEGQEVLILRQDAGLPRLQVYGTGDDEPVSEVPIDPSVVVPYDERRFRTINRKGFSLQTDKGFYIGEVLDQWAQAHLFPKERKLYLAVYRPTGHPFRQWNQWMCPARLRWIEVTLDY